MAARAKDKLRDAFLRVYVKYFNAIVKEKGLTLTLAFFNIFALKEEVSEFNNFF